MHGLLSIFLLLIVLSIPASGETWKGTLLDITCQGKNNANHNRECALKCANTGLGISTPGGKFLKFDKNGNTMALAALKAATDDNLAAEVTGTLRGDTVKVSSFLLGGECCPKGAQCCRKNKGKLSANGGCCQKKDTSNRTSK